MRARAHPTSSIPTPSSNPPNVLAPASRTRTQAVLLATVAAQGKDAIALPNRLAFLILATLAARQPRGARRSPAARHARATGPLHASRPGSRGRMIRGPQRGRDPRPVLSQTRTSQSRLAPPGRPRRTRGVCGKLLLRSS
ncbi:hypothetical protein BD310DRAFT_941298 [Dichomitus squalens]|uniref:Uncharacterized protein n=1 Tax=Dichomitus squalens TaxID=114155 RepID=A0A4Q9PD11_9APHY|nr:hypothetical protein BD310DRAFT_941298 [Dichomitus squalens]